MIVAAPNSLLHVAKLDLLEAKEGRRVKLQIINAGTPDVAASLLGLSTTDWIAVLSAIIALIALYFAIKQGSVQRRHNVLSAKPLLEFHMSTSRNLLSIRNEGFGPASVVSFSAEIDGQTLDMTTRSGLDGFFKALTKGVDQDLVSERVRMAPGSIFGVGKELVVVTLQEELSYRNRQRVAVNIGRLRLLIKFKCIYGFSHQTEGEFVNMSADEDPCPTESGPTSNSAQTDA